MEELSAETPRCVNHPDVETVVRCSRCERPICPKCMIPTPVGMRCRECANLRRAPIYELRGSERWRALGAAIALVVAGTVVFDALLGMFGRSLIVAVVLFLVTGLVVAELLSRAANRKRGPAMQTLAIAVTIVITQSSVATSLVLTHHPSVSLLALFLTVAACILAWERLR